VTREIERGSGRKISMLLAMTIALTRFRRTLD
jgi:hypothetical protein